MTCDIRDCNEQRDIGSCQAWIVLTGAYENEMPEAIHTTEAAAKAHAERLEAEWDAKYKDGWRPTDCTTDIWGPLPINPKVGEGPR